jgi:excisionase family DNA binding protein
MSNNWLTVPSIAESLGIDAGKVLGWLRSGELTGVNVAHRRDGRPRWRVSAEALEQFLQRRQSSPPAPPKSRRKRQAGVIEFY